MGKIKGTRLDEIRKREMENASCLDEGRRDV